MSAGILFHLWVTPMRKKFPLRKKTRDTGQDESILLWILFLSGLGCWGLEVCCFPPDLKNIPHPITCSSSRKAPCNSLNIFPFCVYHKADGSLSSTPSLVLCVGLPINTGQIKSPSTPSHIPGSQMTISQPEAWAPATLAAIPSLAQEFGFGFLLGLLSFYHRTEFDDDVVSLQTPLDPQ